MVTHNLRLKMISYIASPVSALTDGLYATYDSILSFKFALGKSEWRKIDVVLNEVIDATEIKILEFLSGFFPFGGLISGVSGMYCRRSTGEISRPVIRP